MAIGHRLKFFTLINQKIREVKKGMTNVSFVRSSKVTNGIGNHK